MSDLINVERVEEGLLHYLRGPGGAVVFNEDGSKLELHSKSELFDVELKPCEILPGKECYYYDVEGTAGINLSLDFEFAPVDFWKTLEVYYKKYLSGIPEVGLDD